MSDFELGLIGHPVEHSMSPAMHNAVFEGLGLDFRYGLFDLLENELEGFIEKAKDEMIGVNVTIPHKVNVIPFVDKLSREAELIGAVNTLKFEDGRVLGFNTDGLGCVKALDEAGFPVKGKNVLILGAGGAARAISFQAVLEGANVSLSNREEEKQMVLNLASELNEKTKSEVMVVDMVDETLARELSNTDVLVHATPVGMHPHEDGILISSELIPSEVAVMDIVYNPLETRLLREAKERGCPTISGVGMLVHQGVECEKIWLGIDPPVDVMKKIVIQALNQG
ncbi:MAG: shikimate dehydrogenase [Methanobacteriota archaeon]